MVKKSACNAGDRGQEDPLEKTMATRSSILAWRIPWTEEPGRLQSMGSQRVGQDWETDTFTFKQKLSFFKKQDKTAKGMEPLNSLSVHLLVKEMFVVWQIFYLIWGPLHAGILFPSTGIELVLLTLEAWVLPTGPPGKSPDISDCIAYMHRLAPGFSCQ